MGPLFMCARSVPLTQHNSSHVVLADSATSSGRPATRKQCQAYSLQWTGQRDTDTCLLVPMNCFLREQYKKFMLRDRMLRGAPHRGATVRMDTSGTKKSRELTPAYFPPRSCLLLLQHALLDNAPNAYST